MFKQHPTSYYEELLPKKHYLDIPIPQHLHQVFLGKRFEELPKEMQENIRYIQRLNPDWEYHFWGDDAIEAFILEAYTPDILRYFRLISPIYKAAQSDFFRYLLMYHYGGVYMDIKATMDRPLSRMILPTDRYILYHWNNDAEGPYKGFGRYPDLPAEQYPYGEYPQGFIFCSPGHPLLRAILLEAMRRLDNYSPFREGVGLWGVLRTTGPIMYTQTIEQTRPKLDPSTYRWLRCAEELGLQISIYESDGAFAHRKKISTYHNQLSAVSLNGSERLTRLLYPAFFGWRVLRILGDKIRQRLGR